MSDNLGKYIKLKKISYKLEKYFHLLFYNRTKFNFINLLLRLSTTKS